MSKGLDTDLLRQITHAMTIEENEDTWELKEKTMLQLQSFALQHLSPSTALLLTLLRNMHFVEGFTASIKSLRTQLATTSCQTLSILIKILREDFEPFGEYFMATLLKTCAQTKRIVANAAGQTIKELIFNVPSPKYLQLLYNVIVDRNSLLRSRGAEFFRDLVPKINFKSPYKPTTIELIENCLRKMLGDANSIVREFGCEVLDMYQLLWPGKVGEFIESLDYSTRKQLLKKDERMAAAFPTFSATLSSISHSSSQMKESSLMYEEPNDLFCSSNSIQSPRKSLYEDFLENETRRVESKILMEKSIEFLKQNQVELKVFHILGLKELEEIALTETPKFLPVQMFYDESKGTDPINSLKNIIVKSKDDSVWNADEFESALNRIFEYSAKFSRENSLYAFFVLLSNQGTYYMRQISVETWKRLMNLLSEKGTAELDEIKSIEDEIILLLGSNVSFENVCLMFNECCEQNISPSFLPSKHNSLSASSLGFSSVKYVENHFDLLHQSLISCSDRDFILKYLEVLKDPLYQSFLCSKTKLLANRVFIELYKKIGGDKLFDIFCTFERPVRKAMELSCKFYK